MNKNAVVKWAIAGVVLAVSAGLLMWLFTPKYTVILDERQTFTLETDSPPCNTTRVWKDAVLPVKGFNTCLEGGMNTAEIVKQATGSTSGKKYTVDADIEVREYTQYNESGSSSTRQAASIKKVYSIQESN